MTKFIQHLWRFYGGFAAVFILGLGLSGAALASFEIKEAKWESGDNLLVVKGKCDRRSDVTVTNADTGASVGSTRCREEWKVETDYSNNMSAVPCRVSAVQERDGEVDERTAIDASTWYSDFDADGYGDAGRWYRDVECDQSGCSDGYGWWWCLESDDQYNGCGECLWSRRYRYRYGGGDAVRWYDVCGYG